MKTANQNTSSYKVVTEDELGNQIIIDFKSLVEFIQEDGLNVHDFIADLNKAKDTLVADIDETNFDKNPEIYFGVNKIYNALKDITIDIKKGGKNG